jgi:integrase
LSANTGMRRGELLGLRWGDIDFARSSLSVNRALISVAYELHESRGKTRTSQRSINLDAATIAVLNAWRDERVAELGRPLLDRDYVVASADGEPIHPDRFSQCFRRIVASIDVPRIRLHDLRHTHATLLLKEHTPIKVVSERLGHASPAFTMATYQHVLPGMQADAARVFGTLCVQPASTR